MHSIRARRALTWLGAFAALSLSTIAQAEAPARLPLRNVRFYETGVAYFERRGAIDGASRLTLPLPTAQLDDALKSLVVLSNDGKARLAAVEFDSTVGPELGRALAGIGGEQEDAPLGWVRVLRSLKGADVSVRTATETVRGRLVDVLDAAADENAECIERVATTEAPRCSAVAKSSTLVVLAADGAVRRFRSAEVRGVRPVDAGLAERLRTALGAVAPGSDQLARGVRILGTPGTQVTLGYVTETPVWRSTYRVVFQKAKTTLQGWALIHNDTDEAWKGVHVELVNGRPDAFLYPLAAPRYARRELVTPENALSTVPQLLAEGSPDRQWRGEGGGLGVSGVGEGGGGSGYGIGLGRIGTVGHGAGVSMQVGGSSGESESTELSVGDLAGVAGATGVEAEALFRYSLPDAIDLRAHGSALVPFVSKAFSATRIAWFPTAGETARSAARVKNDTGQTLPAGTIAFFADGGFSGEALLDRMKPDDVRVVGFGVDLDVELSVDDKTDDEEVRAVEFERDLLRVHFVRRRTIACTIENHSGTSRQVYWTLPVVHNARIEGADGLDFDNHAQTPLARFDVAAKTDAVKTLSVEEGLSRGHPFGALTSEIVARLAASPKVARDRARTLEAAAAQLKIAEAQREEASRVDRDLRSADDDITRLRANLTAAGKSDDTSKFAARLLAAEDRLKAGRDRFAAAQRAEVAAVAAARDALSRLVRTGS